MYVQHTDLCLQYKNNLKIDKKKVNNLKEERVKDMNKQVYR